MPCLSSLRFVPAYSNLNRPQPPAIRLPTQRSSDPQSPLPVPCWLRPSHWQQHRPHTNHHQRAQADMLPWTLAWLLWCGHSRTAMSRPCWFGGISSSFLAFSMAACWLVASTVPTNLAFPLKTRMRQVWFFVFFVMPLRPETRWSAVSLVNAASN